MKAVGGRLVVGAYDGVVKVRSDIAVHVTAAAVGRQGALERTSVATLFDCCTVQASQCCHNGGYFVCCVKVFQMLELQCQYTLRQHYGHITTMAVDEVCVRLFICLSVCVNTSVCSCH